MLIVFDSSFKLAFEKLPSYVHICYMLNFTPFPYQGSKRKIAPDVLSLFPDSVDTLIEPFCGASAVSLLAAKEKKIDKIILNDLNKPLVKLWDEILWNPEDITNRYSELWNAQLNNPKKYFLEKREEFNKTHSPDLLLYLLARIVKGAVRYNSNGDFNQSADNRRKGMRPNKMRKNIMRVSLLLADITSVYSKDYKNIANLATPKDLVYMDPPYQGTSFTRDHRYFEGVKFNEFVNCLDDLNTKETSYIISYDGACGKKRYGKKLPESLNLKHLFINTGRSTQSTLLGRSDSTVESLYLSPALLKRLDKEDIQKSSVESRQVSLTLN
jgi:DNA adenine methylase